MARAATQPTRSSRNGSDAAPTVENKRSWWARHERIWAFLLGLVAMSYIQSGSYEPSGRDSFYHIKMSVILPEYGFSSHFPWLRHSILYDHHISHHHGFHVLMVPFVYVSKWVADVMPDSLSEWADSPSKLQGIRWLKMWVGGWLDSPYILGGKVLNAILFGLIVLLFTMILERLNVPLRWFWILAIFCLPSDFLLRMSYIRAPALSLALLLAGFYCFLQNRTILLCILSAIACHLYLWGMFLGLFVAIVAVCWLVLLMPLKPLVRILTLCAVGYLVGWITHPYRGGALQFLGIQVFQTGLQIDNAQSVRVGGEWSSYSFQDWLWISGFVLTVLGISLVYRFSWTRIMNPFVLVLMVMNGAFLAMCLWAMRFIEYWPIFALLSSASLWQGFDRQVAEWDGKFKDKLGSLVDLNAIYRKHYGLICLIAAVVGSGTLFHVQRAATTRFNIHEIKRAMRYLQSITPDELDPDQAVVFAHDWDEFPIYFYYNHKNGYVCGLDPQFTNSIDPVLWERYCVITQGRAPTQSSVQIDGETDHFQVNLEDIRTYFGASYVIVDRDHGPLYRDLLKHKDVFEYIYPRTSTDQPPRQQPDLSIFRVLEPKSATPSDSPHS